MKPKNTLTFLITVFSLFVILACTASFTAEFPTATSPAPTETATVPPLPPTPTPANPPPFVISALGFNETGPNSEYTITAQIPAILENTDPRASKFNEEMQTLVQNEIAGFKKAVAEIPHDPASATNFLDVKYGLLFQNDHIVSIKIEFSAYTGGAHPYGYSAPVNYDFNQGRSLSLDELFLPNSNYLELIASYCIAELSKQPFFEGPFQEGAQPTAENYHKWNIANTGLVITFDEYKVAPYAAGPQVMVVPYSGLQAVIKPQGPVAGITP